MATVKKFLILPGKLGDKIVTAIDIIDQHNLNPEECEIMPVGDSVNINDLWAVPPLLNKLDDFKHTMTKPQWMKKEGRKNWVRKFFFGK